METNESQISEFSKLPCCLQFTDDEYRRPSIIEIKQLIRIMGLTGSQVAALVGVNSSRTVRKWTGGEREIPYSAWRLLLIYAGIAIPTEDMKTTGAARDDIIDDIVDAAKEWVNASSNDGNVYEAETRLKQAVEWLG